MKLTMHHSILCDCSREIVYQIICNAEKWPDILEPCISVKTLLKDTHTETVEVSAWINNEKMTWQSKRTFLKDTFGIDAELIKPMPLVKYMHAFWRVLSENNNQQCLLILDHAFEISDNIDGKIKGVLTKADAIDFMKKAIDVNSKKELMNIKNVAENKNEK